MLPLFYPIFAYAETHYRFRFFFNLLKKREPEIIADLPHHLSAGHDLPVLLVVKDAHQYPVTIQRLTLFIDDRKTHTFELNRLIEESYFDDVLYLDRNKMTCGYHEINVRIDYQIRGRNISCFNDNYKTINSRPFKIHLNSEPLPGFEGYVTGDMHTHTNFTDDQIEFGASLQGTLKMAEAAGLQYFCAADHSYDLDDCEGDYTRNDRSLSKWVRYLREIAAFNSTTDSFLIVPGEEVTVRNDSHKNLHLLVYNSKKFFPGTGDSGDTWFNTRSEHSIREIVGKLESGSVAAAAHVVDHVPRLQKWFLNRTEWQPEDISGSGLKMVQIMNGSSVQHIEQGLEFWKALLIDGQKIVAFAGNDAHGDFGRSRQMHIPFVSIREKLDQLFGQWRTSIYYPWPSLEPHRLLASLERGNSYLTNGPALKITVWFKGNPYPMGCVIDGADDVELEAVSSKDYGALDRVRLLCGEIGTKSESVLFEKKIKEGGFRLHHKLPIPRFKGRNYIRAEAVASGQCETFRAFTNPIWIET